MTKPSDFSESNIFKSLAKEIFSSTEPPDQATNYSNQYSKKTSCECFRAEFFWQKGGKFFHFCPEWISRNLAGKATPHPTSDLNTDLKQ